MNQYKKAKQTLMSLVAANNSYHDDDALMYYAEIEQDCFTLEQLETAIKEFEYTQDDADDAREEEALERERGII